MRAAVVFAALMLLAVEASGQRAPRTAAVPVTTREGPLFEFACHEGNYGMTGILAGHRAEERAAAAARRP